jgi:hypothetical protein
MRLCAESFRGATTTHRLVARCERGADVSDRWRVDAIASTERA